LLKKKTADTWKTKTQLYLYHGLPAEGRATPSPPPSPSPPPPLRLRPWPVMACHGRPWSWPAWPACITPLYSVKFLYDSYRSSGHDVYRFDRSSCYPAWTSSRSSHEDSRVRDSWASRTHCTRPVRPLHCMINRSLQTPAGPPNTDARDRSPNKIEVDFIPNYASNFSPRPSITTVAQAADRAPVPSNTRGPSTP
jgi:hypothetical protein